MNVVCRWHPKNTIILRATLLGSNPLMLGLAYYLFEDRPLLDSQTAAIILGGATALAIFGAACVLEATPENYRGGFYQHNTLAMYVRSFAWNEQTSIKIDGKVKTGCTRELVRAAEVIGEHARCYWPDDLVRPFVRENRRVSCVIVHAIHPCE